MACSLLQKMHLEVLWLMTSAYSNGFVAHALQSCRHTLRAVNSFSTPKPRSSENRPIRATDDIPNGTSKPKAFHTSPIGLRI